MDRLARREACDFPLIYHEPCLEYLDIARLAHRRDQIKKCSSCASHVGFIDVAWAATGRTYKGSAPPKWLP